MKLTGYVAATATALLVSGCATATHQTARLEAAKTLQRAAVMDSHRAELIGANSDAWGDTWTATNLYERAVDKGDTVTGRFNLAAGYQRTGRLAQAVALYERVAQEGQFVWGIKGLDNRNPGARLEKINLADESARRLAAIRSRTAFAPSAGGGAVAAGELGVPVSATVGLTGAPARISDQEAILLDARNNP